MGFVVVSTVGLTQQSAESSGKKSVMNLSEQAGATATSLWLHRIRPIAHASPQRGRYSSIELSQVREEIVQHVTFALRPLLVALNSVVRCGAIRIGRLISP